MSETTISATDLRVLLNVAEGFTTENGLDAVARYAIPKEVQRAINHAIGALCNLDGKPQSNGTVAIQS